MHNLIKALLILVTITSLNSNAFSVTKPENVNVAQNAVKPATVLNINQANEQQLALLKGIGLKKAKAIVAYRDTNGEFTSVKQLLKVKGIGEQILSLNKAKLSI